VNRVELVSAGFAAYNRGDAEAVLALMHPEVEVHSSGTVGEAGTYHGHEGYLRWVSLWLDAWERFVIEADEVEELDEENVLVHVNQTGRGRGSGVEVTQTVTYLFTVRDDLLTRLHLYADREEALAAWESFRA
jgi:ketosteroid isomerase-like protein